MLEISKNADADVHTQTPEYCDEKTQTFCELVSHIAESVDGETYTLGYMLIT